MRVHHKASQEVLLINLTCKRKKEFYLQFLVTGTCRNCAESRVPICTSSTAEHAELPLQQLSAGLFPSYNSDCSYLKAPTLTFSTSRWRKTATKSSELQSVLPSKRTPVAAFQACVLDLCCTRPAPNAGSPEYHGPGAGPGLAGTSCGTDGWLRETQHKRPIEQQPPPLQIKKSAGNLKPSAQREGAEQLSSGVPMVQHKPASS